MTPPENRGARQNSPKENQPATPHESAKVAVVDGDESKKKPASSWVKKNKAVVASVATALAVAIGAGGLWLAQDDDPPANTQDVVAKREVNKGLGQQTLPEARTIEGVGKGVFSAIDPLTNKKVNADIVGIDTTGDPNNATLPPPEDISKAGWYIRSAPFGVDEGSTVLTSHIDYNGVVGLGTLFSSLRKGDPVTLSDGNGKQHHYVVTQAKMSIDKQDPEYIKKTMATINKKSGENILVMVTCGGNYNPASPLGYDQNFITVAKPVKSSDDRGGTPKDIRK